MKYSKTALSNADLLARWQAKGLQVPDLDAARRALTFIGYFRLRGYALPLMRTEPNGSRVFQADARFPDILARYELDRDLRRITLGQLERIEVAVRTVISNQMSQQYGPFWYLNHPQQVLAHAPGRNNRPEAFAIGRFLSGVERDTRHSTDLFAKHYFDKYTEPLLPPSWLMAECVSFGTWSKLYKHLQKAEPKHPNPKKEIAKVFGLSVSLLESWLHGLSLLRNTCAHHGRVWNRRFGYRPEIYAQAKHHFADQQSFYCLAVVTATWAARLCPQGNCPTACWTISLSGHASAKARMFAISIDEQHMVALRCVLLAHHQNAGRNAGTVEWVAGQADDGFQITPVDEILARLRATACAIPATAACEILRASDYNVKLT